MSIKKENVKDVSDFFDENGRNDSMIGKEITRKFDDNAMKLLDKTDRKMENLREKMEKIGNRRIVKL